MLEEKIDERILTIISDSQGVISSVSSLSFAQRIDSGAPQNPVGMHIKDYIKTWPLDETRGVHQQIGELLRSGKSFDSIVAVKEMQVLITGMNAPNPVIQMIDITSRVEGMYDKARMEADLTISSTAHSLRTGLIAYGGWLKGLDKCIMDSEKCGIEAIRRKWEAVKDSMMTLQEIAEKTLIEYKQGNQANLANKIMQYCPYEEAIKPALMINERKKYDKRLTVNDTTALPEDKIIMTNPSIVTPALMDGIHNAVHNCRKRGIVSYGLEDLPGFWQIVIYNEIDKPFDTNTNGIVSGQGNLIHKQNLQRLEEGERKGDLLIEYADGGKAVRYIVKVPKPNDF